jgi:hypothetical protein
MLKANFGRVVVQPDTPKEKENGFVISEKPPQWGTVVDIGPPMSDIYSPEEMEAWDKDKVHPCLFKIGDRVLLPNVGNDVGELRVFWQHDISCWEDGL